MAEAATPTDGLDQKTYEVGYLLSPLVPTEALAAAVDKFIKAAIVGASGEVLDDWPARRVTLAYPIKRLTNNKTATFREAFFGSLRFRSQPEAAAGLGQIFRASPEVIRHLLLEVSKSDLIHEARLRFQQKKALLPSSRPVEKNKSPMSADELDKEIDQLLTAGTYVSK